MTQSTDVTLSDQSGSSYRTEHNAINQAFASMHKGSAQPSYAVTGMLWIDDSSTPWVLKVFDGSTSNAIMEIDATANTNIIINHGSGNARTKVSNIGQIQDSSFTYAGTSSGTNTITASVTPAITAYVAGQRFSFLAGGSNSGAATLNINGLGAKTIQKRGAALASGDITAGNIVVVEYDGTQFQMISPATAATPSDASTTVKGIVELATDAELQTGTDATRAITPSNVLNSLGFADYFISADQTITSGGLLTIAHGLGRTPALVQVRLKCVSALLGWSNGDVFIFNNHLSSSDANSRGHAVYFDATNVYLRFGSATAAYVVLNKGTGAQSSATNTNFNAIIQAWG
jgi:hypothetical protein